VTERPAVETDGLVKRFPPLTALSAVDMQVAVGEVVALLGPNGAGKTTAVRILATLLTPDAGRARVMGFDVVRQAGAVRRMIGLSGQYAAVDAYLTGPENLRMIGRLSGLPRRAARRRSQDLLELFGLAGVAGRTVRTYSGGMRRRLDLAAALVASPAVLFLDEPTTGLDPRGRLDLWLLLEDLARQGTSILLTTQYLEEADRLADAVVVLDRGRTIATGSPDDLKRRAGGARLELLVPPGVDPRPVESALWGLGSAPATVDAETGRVVIPVADGPAVLPAVATRLAAAGVPVLDLALRRPTLDDVFLILTGQAAGRADHTEAGHR
jgi:daunorubicin resistance ABC transporter ATP-binding subunit